MTAWAKRVANYAAMRLGGMFLLIGLTLGAQHSEMTPGLCQELKTTLQSMPRMEAAMAMTAMLEGQLLPVIGTVKIMKLMIFRSPDLIFIYLNRTLSNRRK